MTTTSDRREWRIVGEAVGLNSFDLEHANDLHRRNDGINEKEGEKRRVTTNSCLPT